MSAVNSNHLDDLIRGELGMFEVDPNTSARYSSMTGAIADRLQTSENLNVIDSNTDCCGKKSIGLVPTETNSVLSIGGKNETTTETMVMTSKKYDLKSLFISHNTNQKITVLRNNYMRGKTSGKKTQLFC